MAREKSPEIRDRQGSWYSMKKRMLLTLAVLIAAAITALAGLGVWRYGSPDNLWHRVEAEVAVRQPHPVFVPTPLPVTPASAGARTPTVSPPPTALPTVQSTLLPIVEAARTAISAAPSAPSPTPPVPHTATPAPTMTRAPTATATPSPTALPPSVRLTGLTHLWQTWNNCGPATLAMNLSYFGKPANQADVAATLRPYKDDKNVAPEELAAYARGQGLHALARANGDSGRLRQLLAAGVPVLIETWHEPKPNDGMGHYRLLAGYDDSTSQWIAYDSYDTTGLVKGQPYAGIRLPYAGLDELWAVFNRQYIVIYDEPRAPVIERILDDDLDDAAMWSRALAGANEAVRRRPADPFAWFNLGADLVAAGRFQDAAAAYDQARQIGLPWRMLWYQFGPFQAYHEVGRYDEVIALADATLRTARYVEELFFWRGLAQKASGNIDGARILAARTGA